MPPLCFGETGVIWPMRRTILLLAAVALALSPAAAQRLHYLDPQDDAEAQRDNSTLIQELGGAEPGPRVADVPSGGHRAGTYSGHANSFQPLHSTPLNQAVATAFSLPRL